MNKRDPKIDPRLGDVIPTRFCAYDVEVDDVCDGFVLYRMTHKGKTTKEPCWMPIERWRKEWERIKDE